MPIYMKYDNNSIKGNVTAADFTDQIELSSAQLGVGRGVSTPVGSSKDREASAPSVSELTVTKTQDQASRSLFKEALQGKSKSVEIAFVNNENGKLTAYCTLTLSDTMISGYSLSSGGDRPTESLSLNFAKIEYKFAEKDVDGNPSNASSSYDIGTATLA